MNGVWGATYTQGVQAGEDARYLKTIVTLKQLVRGWSRYWQHNWCLRSNALVRLLSDAALSSVYVVFADPFPSHQLGRVLARKQRRLHAPQL